MPIAPKGCLHAQAIELEFHGGTMAIAWCPNCGTLQLVKGPGQWISAVTLTLARTPAIRASAQFFPALLMGKAGDVFSKDG